jgi:hypothetical protein
MKQKPEPYKSVSEPDEIPAATPVPCEARIAKLSDSVGVIECKDAIQWVLQRRRGDQWQGCRSAGPEQP